VALPNDPVAWIAGSRFCIDNHGLTILSRVLGQAFEQGIENALAPHVLRNFLVDLGSARYDICGAASGYQ